MTWPKVVLGVALALGFLSSLVRVARQTDTDDPLDVTTSAVAAVLSGVVYAVLFTALAHA